MSDKLTSATTMIDHSASELGLDALNTLLTHAPDLLKVRDVGNLSICSRELASIVDPYWRRLFVRYVGIGTRFDCRSRPGHKFVCWNREPGLLPCFAEPDVRILARVGYKRAAGCLASNTCHRCGSMAAEANPLTLERTCPPCADADEASWFVPKTKAKEAFLLGEKDLRPLPSARVPAVTVGGKEGTSVLYLISDVEAASFARYGGAGGLEAEFRRRTAAAAGRYARSLTTGRPQKKRPRIERMSHRPADDPRRLRCWFGLLPIGSVYVGSGGDVLMTHSTECNAPGCTVGGDAADVVLHERLEHEMLPWIFENPSWVQLSPPSGRAPMDLLGVPEELKALISKSHTKYTRTGREGSPQYEGEPFGDPDATYTSCDIILSERSGCKLVVEMEQNIGDHISWGEFTVSCQLRSNGMPICLLRLGLGASCDHVHVEEGSRFEALHDALGLRETTPGQILAAVVTHSLPLRDFFGEVFNYSYAGEDMTVREPYLSASKFPVFREAFRLLFLTFVKARNLSTSMESSTAARNVSTNSNA